ncbi:MAG: CARDB domain-containing protein [Solirubrobacterales bacterium]
MAFLDEEDQLAAPPEEPERPRRTPPERRRQQYLLRRLIAVGVGIAFLILIVVGIRGCLEARSDRGLRNYAQDVGTIMQESQTRGGEFFEALEGGTGTEQELEQQISAIRGASAALLDRAEGLGAPDQMRDAQSATTLALRLRRDALEEIAANIGAATADRETADAVEVISTQMGSLYASDILWGQLASPEISTVLEQEDVESQDLPAGNFMPEGDAVRFLDQTEIVNLIGGVGGDEAAAGLQGLGLISTVIGDTTLDPETTTTVASDADEITVEVQNQGESEVTDVNVVITLGDQAPIEKPIPRIEPGATEVANIPIETLPQPGTEIQLDVLVQPVPGEGVSENNEATYTIVFGTE